MQRNGGTCTTIDIPILYIRNTTETTIARTRAERSPSWQRSGTWVARKIRSTENCTTVPHQPHGLQLTAVAYRKDEITVARPSSIAVDMIGISSGRRSTSPQPVQSMSWLAFISSNHSCCPAERINNLPFILQRNVAGQLHGVHSYRSRATDGRLRLACIEDIQTAATSVLIAGRSVKRGAGSRGSFGKTSTI